MNRDLWERSDSDFGVLRKKGVVIFVWVLLRHILGRGEIKENGEKLRQRYPASRYELRTLRNQTAISHPIKLSPVLWSVNRVTVATCGQIVGRLALVSASPSHFGSPGG